MEPVIDSFSLSAYWERHGRRIEEALEALLVPRAPMALWEAMAYSVTAGGKRIRPLLTLAACEAAGAESSRAMGAACALELVHTQSLIHDDLPCMDDDTLRRGRPTNHVVFGEATALLAGDGLLAYAFQVLAEALAPIDPARAVVAIAEFAQATLGMVAGQVVDMQSELERADASTLEFIHRHKTGELLVAAMRLGGHAAQADPTTMAALTAFGEGLGMAFQIVDDLLDLSGTSAALGKHPGKDVVQAKATYPALHGLSAARAEVERQIERALTAIAPLGPRAVPLRAIARFVAERDH